MPRRNCRDCKVTSTHDRFRNKTELTLFPMTVFDGPGGVLSLSLQAEYEGAIQKGYRREFVIALISLTKTFARAGDTELYALVNGEPVSFGKLLPVKQFTDGPFFVVSYANLIDRNTLAKLALAKKVEMRFDTLEFKLSPDQQVAMLDFLAYADGDHLRQ